MTMALPRRHPIHESIDKHQIRRVAIVDDAFDPVSLASFQEGEEQEFLAAVNAQDQLLKEFHQIVSGTDSDQPLNSADLTDAAVKLLWESREKGGAIGPALSQTLFRVLELKVAQVEKLFAFLKNELGIEDAQKYGTNAEMPDGEFDVAFIDYRFGPSRQSTSVERAMHWAKHLYRKGRTFIVLMSAEAEASARQEKFRDGSDLTRGLFGFIDKEEIAESVKFSNRLNSFCAGLDIRHEIHRFALAAEAAIDEAVSELKRSIHGLGLEDYAYLEQISLREDGHPLGDYMLWLFGEYFGHELAASSALGPARKQINSLKYERFLPLQRPPSAMLATMYGAAVTEPVHEGWGPHPRDVDQVANSAEGSPPSQPVVASETPLEMMAPTPESGVPPQDEPPPADIAVRADMQTSVEGLPLYQLGDMIVADRNKPAFLVLNAGCDLQFSPGWRDSDPEQTILLLPGRFEALHEQGAEVNERLLKERKHESNAKRTELFELDGERFRIIWHHTRARAVPHDQVRRTFEPEGYQRMRRMKLPHALEIQQHFAAQLTRVGVPVPTPVFRERPVKMYGKGPNGDCHLLETIKSGLIIFHHRGRDQFVLTVDCIQRVLEQLDGFAKKVAEEPALRSRLPGVQGEDVILEKAADRRRKYLESIRETREALAHDCIFQTSLRPLPTVTRPAFQIDEISKSDKRYRLEIRHAPSVVGQYQSNAPIVLAFSLADSPLTTSTVNTDVVSVSDQSIVPPVGKQAKQS